jgi:hypothetical protein
MKNEEKVFAELDRLMAIDPKDSDIEAIIYALDWVLERTGEEDLEI